MNKARILSKKALSFSIAIIFVLGTIGIGASYSLFNPTAFATEPDQQTKKAAEIANGVCGSDLTWVLDEEGQLTISGTGDMFNYSSLNDTGEEQSAGYKYDADKNFYYIDDKECWKNDAGYNEVNDNMAPMAGMFIDQLRVRFSYDNKDWLIQLWKGQYGLLLVGAETGVFTAPEGTYKNDNSVVDYKVADKEDWLDMQVDCYWDEDSDGVYNNIFSREYGKYWWATGFVKGQLTKYTIPKTELKVKNRITFKSVEMADLFAEGLKDAGFVRAVGADQLVDDSYYKNGADVWLLWTTVYHDAYVGDGSEDFVTTYTTNVEVIPVEPTTDRDIPTSASAESTSKSEIVVIKPASTTKLLPVPTVQPTTIKPTSATSKPTTTTKPNTVIYKPAPLPTVSDTAAVTRIDSQNYSEEIKTQSNEAVQTSGKWTNYIHKIKKVVINDGVTSIGNYAFSDCSLLEEVTMPDSITRIGDAAFSNCIELKEVEIPENTKTVGAVAFENCYDLDKLTIPESVVSVGESAFKGVSISEVYYTGDIAGWCNIEFADPDSCPMYNSPRLYIDGKLLEGDVVIPEGVTRIGKGAFRNTRYHLRSITIPKSMKNIGESAFAPASSWNGVSGRGMIVNYAGSEEKWNAMNIEAGNENLLDAWRVYNYVETGFYTGKCGDNLTWQFNKITGELTISGTGDMSGYTDWYPCEVYGVESLKIEEGVTSIGERAFEFMYGKIKNVTIADTVTTIKDCAFLGCSFENIVIPNSVIYIGYSAFAYCESLKSVTIPESVNKIEDGAFYRCYSLERIDVHENNENYSSDEYGVFFNKDKTKLICYPAGNTRENYVVPASTTIIRDQAFLCSDFVSIIIPDSVKTIESYAFDECSNLTDIYFNGTEGDWNNIEGIELNHFKNVTIHFKKKLDTQTDDVILECFDDTFESGVNVNVKVTEKAIDPHFYFSTNVSTGEVKKYKPCLNYDITLKNGDIEIQPSGKVTVKLKIPTNKNVSEQDIIDENIMILHYPKDPQYEGERDTIIGAERLRLENGYIVFEIDHFSYFMVCIESDEPTVETKIPTLKIRNNPGTATVNYGDVLWLTADVTDLPEGCEVWWFFKDGTAISGEEVGTMVNKDDTVTVKILDSEGNPLKDENGNEISDTQEIKVKDTLWLRIVSFFKNLFRIDRHIVQSLFEIAI